MAVAEELLEEQLDGSTSIGPENPSKEGCGPATKNAEWPHAAADLELHQARIESFGLYRLARRA